MAEWTKHRREKDNYGHDFGTELGDEEELSDAPTPTVTILKQSGAEWVDVSSEFGSRNPGIVDGSRTGKENAQVDFTLNPAADGAQDGGIYAVRIEATTTSTRQLVAVILDRRSDTYRLPSLEVLEGGDPAAP
jgi:hypothetical protein